ncbi:ATP-dependent helicase [Chryseobacterium camelliae]|uniref:3'-5' exonuclease n=1 Tax=Chryseobacterium camelliae TaxID=1265445 RepID=UPI000C1CBEA5|nr:ATP-dependent helicase [Chryseobacterium camelliae]
MSLKPIILTGEQKKVLFLQATEPIQIKGVAGSGKTTIALYRAKHLLDTQSNLFQEAKVVIFTYNRTLVKYIEAIIPYISGGYHQNSDEIIPKNPDGINVSVTNFHKWAYHFLKENNFPLFKQNNQSRVINERQKADYITHIKLKYFTKSITIKSTDFFIEEITWIKGKAFKNKDEYIESRRTGRGISNRVTKADKETIWNIYKDYKKKLDENDQMDFEDFALECLNIIDSNPNFNRPFTHIIVDEAQDLSKVQILVISKLVSEKTRSISIIADAAQRIYKSGFTWAEVGLNVRGGRTIEFKINYRNTIQIVDAAISLLSNETETAEFTEVKRAIKNGKKPVVGYFSNWEEQTDYIVEQLTILKQNNNLNSTVILHRNRNNLKFVQSFLKANNFETQMLQDAYNINLESDSIKICTLFSVKGLEFDNVFIIDLNDDIIPYPLGFIDKDDEFHISTERRLLYTAMTRAKERLFLLSSGNPSRYLFEINQDLLEIVNN